MLTPQQALAALPEQLSGAIRTRSLEPLLAALDDDVLVTVMNSEVCRGKQQVAGYFDRMLGGPGRLLRRMDTRITVEGEPTVLSPTVVLAVGRSDTRYEFRSGHAMDVLNRFTVVVVCRQGDWKVAGFHWSTNIFDNPILNHTRSAVGWAAAAGLAVGLLAGWRLAHRE